MSVAVAGALHYAHRIVARPMGSGGRVDQIRILGQHNVCHALHFGDDDDDDLAWYGIGLLVGVVLLLPSPLRRRSPPPPLRQHGARCGHNAFGSSHA